MKLRDRKKRVLSNVKQEDHKFDFTVTETTSTSIVANDINTCDLNIKQEDTKKYSDLLQQNDKFGNKDYYYRCEICKERMSSLKSVLEHRRSIHKIKQMGRTVVKNIEMEPDIHNTNFYCQSCEIAFDSKALYRPHLRRIHYMTLKPMSKWKTPQGSILPDPDDPNLYCKICKHTYKNKSNYKSHCLYLHWVKSVKFPDQRPPLDITADAHCESCDRRFATKYIYRKHLAAIHRVDWKLIQQKSIDALPDANDSSFYCRSCQKTMANKYSFRIHLKLLHSIHQSVPKKASLTPDVDDPNNYCKSCQRTYSSRGRYCVHLRSARQMALSSLRVKVNGEDLPDPYSPHNHCSVCKKSWKARRNYRYHCKTVHFIEVRHSSISNPNATIDINHPKFYCAKCQHTYTSKSNFRKHLRRVHSI
ncbi:hypothetical protein G6F42_010478 [Rhizopus arrhizus]|nr:hypothetical protein G6F42_010478 [Rhizopus arrhizus]